jgi:hypothetical protein
MIKVVLTMVLEAAHLFEELYLLALIILLCFDSILSSLLKGYYFLARRLEIYCILFMRLVGSLPI